jgi:hypothetical protein
MSTADTPAYTVKIVGSGGTKTSKGLTKRELFAMEAMKAMLSNSRLCKCVNDEVIAELKYQSYTIADEMLKGS